MRKRKPSDDIIIIDLDSPSSGVHYVFQPFLLLLLSISAMLQDIKDQTSKQCSRRKRATRQQQAESIALISKEKLDTQVFDMHFKNMWGNFAEDRRMLFTYFDCLWFSLYMTSSSKENVLTWINEKHIFSKKYVLVPIVYWRHWSLLILCNFGESLRSENENPCMLLLDSLQMAGPRRLEPSIRKFVVDIFRSKGRPETERSISQIPLLVPKVPQQRNGEECGNYVLYFINLFVSQAPPDFSLKEYPYFMKDDWFNLAGFAHFCEKLKYSEK